MNAGTGGVLMADHERIALAACAPYFVLDSTVELQGHQRQSLGRGIVMFGGPPLANHHKQAHCPH